MVVASLLRPLLLAIALSLSMLLLSTLARLVVPSPLRPLLLIGPWLLLLASALGLSVLPLPISVQLAESFPPRLLLLLLPHVSELLPTSRCWWSRLRCRHCFCCARCRCGPFLPSC